MESKHKTEIQIRSATIDDLSQIDKILDHRNMGKSESILRLWFTTSDPIWQVAFVEKNEIVGFYLFHKLPVPKNVVFGINIDILENYQNMGLTRRFTKAHNGASAMGNDTNEAIAKLGSMLKKFHTKLIKFKGNPSIHLLKNDVDSEKLSISILPITDRDTDELVIYDRSVLDMDRSKYTRAWCTNSRPGEQFSKTIIARNKIDNKIVGFGSIRFFDRVYEMQPVYADDQSTAHSILYELVRSYAEEKATNKQLVVVIDAKNRLMMDFLRKMNMKRVITLTRSYSESKDKKIDASEIDEKLVNHDKVYAYQYYWPV